MQQIEKGEKTIPSRYTRPPAKKVNSLRRALGINRTVKRKEETTERTRDVAKLLAQPPYFCNRPTDGGTPWPASTDRSRFMVSLVRSRVPGGGCFKRGLGGGWPTLRPKGFLPLRGFLDQAKSITTTVPHTHSLFRARARFVCRRAWPGHIGPATQRQQTLLACLLVK